MTAPATRPPRFLRAALLLAAKDLRIEGKTRETLSATVLFSLIVLVVFSFAFDLGTVRRLGAETIVPGVLWTTIAFAGVVSFARSFEVEKRREALTALRLAPVDPGALFTGKALANLALLLALETVLLPLSAVLFDWDLLSNAAPTAFVVFVHTAAIAQLGTLFGAVSSRLGRGEALLATLLFPAATPVFISAVECTGSAVAGTGLGPVRHWLLVTAGLTVLYFLVALLTFEFILED
jgi:heme exporter protein B